MKESGPVVQIRHETPDDIEAIASVVIAAFGQPDEARLVEALRDAAEYDPELSLVALQGARIVGHALLTVIAIETDLGPRPALALAPVAVLPEMQRQGVGAALIREALIRAKAKGHRAAIVLGHPDYYRRFDFVSASQFGIHASFDVPDEVFMAVQLVAGGLADCQGTVRYPSAFGV